MKAKIVTIIIVLLITVGFSSCDKKKYFPFSEKELEFAAYAEGQKIRFIDTSHVLNELEQTHYSRIYIDFPGLFVTDFIEKYYVEYSPVLSRTVPLSLELYGKGPDNGGGVLLRFFGYYSSANPDSLAAANAPVTINGRNYVGVYSLKAYKQGPGFAKTDSAIIFFNKQYGVIQMLLPNGKSITRVD